VGSLAKRLHCSRRTLYELAPSKEQLFLRVLDRLLVRIRRAGQQAAARGDLRQRLVASLEPGVSELRGASGLFFADVNSFAPARRMLEAHQRARTEEVRALIEAGIRRRVFRGIHAALVAEAVLATVQRVMSPEFLSSAGLSVSDSVAEVEDLILHGLLHPARRAPARRRARRVAPPRRR
jgi:AcrR family transcriptional regulator